MRRANCTLRGRSVATLPRRRRESCTSPTGEQAEGSQREQADRAGFGDQGEGGGVRRDLRLAERRVVAGEAEDVAVEHVAVGAVRLEDAGQALHAADRERGVDEGVLVYAVHVEVRVRA